MMRIGFGYDVHKFSENRELILGGVKIPFEKGLLGHSDADVLIHAIIDAIIGAMGVGDIGKYFPDSDERFRGISSVKLMEMVHKMLIENKYRIVNIDTTLVLQKPKILPYVDEMKERICNILEIDKNQINIKGKTTEGLGFEGRGEGVSAYAVVLIEKYS